MAFDIKYYAHKVGVNVHHLEWCTKYRYGKIKEDLEYENISENQEDILFFVKEVE